jgi:hypothetical protein
MSSSQATHPATESSTTLRATRAGLIERHPGTWSCLAVDRERDCRALVVRPVVERAAGRVEADRGGAVFRVAISLHQPLGHQPSAISFGLIADG